MNLKLGIIITQGGSKNRALSLKPVLSNKVLSVSVHLQISLDGNLEGLQTHQHMFLQFVKRCSILNTTESARAIY